MDFLDPDLVDYIEAHTQKETPVLSDLNRYTYANILTPRMLAGHLQGQILGMLSMMIKPKQVLEIGTYTGYSAICLCKGLQDGGKLHTIDMNEELEEMARNYFDKAEVTNKIEYHIGNAIEIIPTINEMFDLVYIDADKENYSQYFDMTLDKLNIGGYIISDNVLWSGKVLEKNKVSWDADTIAIREFNEKVHNDDRVENVLFPIRDGLMIARKK
ncbi:MAG: O-methyltransferase [Bacteroidia bacterium]|nr:O-methyltransferase [Bacteroidia bacterium]